MTPKQGALHLLSQAVDTTETIKLWRTVQMKLPLTPTGKIMKTVNIATQANSFIKTAMLTATVVVAGLGSSQLLAFDKVVLQDLDGDGVISAEEIRQVREDVRNSMLETFDTDGDGELSREERKAIKQARQAEFVSLHDTDGDGNLSRDEKKQAKQVRMEVIMQQLDTDGDGTVSDAERAGFDEVKAERRGHRKDRGDRKQRRSGSDE